MPFDPSNQSLDSPLLPYEKELIRILGCTEEEYKNYVKEVRDKGKTRPAEYAVVPEIKAEISTTTLLIIQLVVGLAAVAASVLLQPKPQAAEERRRGKNIRLASRQGTERFGATSGFDSLADLANYAEPIAVLFAKREDNIGGVLASPQMVWSRCFSYGNEQGVKMMFILGEGGLGQGIRRPDLEGIFLGTTPLDGQYANKYAFYWNRNDNVNGRILAKNWAYGTRNFPAAGDPQTNDDIFLCPIGSAVNAKGFSQSYTPSSNNTFGCYGAIRNGTGYRVNWELIPLPIQDGESASDDDTEDRLRGSVRKRWKIAGDWGEGGNLGDIIRLGQKGVGREYGTRMGLRFHNGQSVAPGGPNGHKVKRSVAVGDTATYVIGGNVIEEGRYWAGDDSQSANVDDINNQTIRWREEADDTLQIGQIVMIGRTVWVVTSRSEDRWGAGTIGPFDPRGTQSIELECIEVFADGAPGNEVGFISDQVITRGVFTDDQGKGEYEYPTDNNNGLTVGPGFYPLTRVSFGIVRNTRPCETTEFGLKSQVWNRAAGLCNFASLLKPAGMRDADKRGDSITSGTMNTYFNRASVFTIWLRPAGRDDAGNEYTWEPLGEQFAIRGSRPIDQYNFLRIIHAQTREYEFKFVPKSGADLAQNSPDDAEFWLLDARLADFKRQGVLLHRSYTVGNYGSFGVQAAGQLVSKGELEFAPEMSTGLKTNTENRPIINAPQGIFISEYLPDIDEAGAVAETITQGPAGYTSVPEGDKYRQAAFFYELWGQPGAEGSTSTTTKRFDNLRGGKWLSITFTGTVSGRYPVGQGHPMENWKYFTLTSMTVAGSSDGMNTGEIFNCRVPVSPGNPRNFGGYTSVGVEVQILTTTATAGPGGRQNGYSYEVLGNADGLAVGTRKTARITLVDGSRSTEIEYGATVVDAPDPVREAFGVSKVWDQESAATVENSTTGNWTVQATVDDVYSVSDSNPFRPADSEVGARYQVDSLRQEQEIIGINSDRVFEENAGITDLSYYTERETSNSSNAEHQIVYVSETLASEPEYKKLTSCGLALRSGREFTRVDQLRTWLYDGIEVKNFHPDDGGATQASNLLPDLVYYLMTDKTAGLGELLSTELIDTDSFATACKFLRTNKLYFNGAITEPTNLRDFVTEIAPFFLMDFAILGGKFSFTPAIPVTSAGAISTAAVPISFLFTEGNIIEDTFEISYLEADQRRDFIAVMRWRDEQVNQLPEEKTVAIRWNDSDSSNHPIESFDMTEYCCSEDHAVLAAKYLLSLRRRVTHTVKFKTTPDGLNLAPGQYIKVVTQASPYQPANNGVIEADGTLITTRPLSNSTYDIYYFKPGNPDVQEGRMTVVDGVVTEQSLRGSVFTLKSGSTSALVYQVQQLTLDEDGLVEVVALEHPTDGSGVSKIALDLQPNSGNFRRGF